MGLVISIKESLRQQIWTLSNRNLYFVVICMQRCGGWRDEHDADINFYTRVLNTIRNIKNKSNGTNKA